MIIHLNAGAARGKWPLTRALELLVTLGYARLAIDVRLEHVDVVRERWRSWIPIIYALLMVLMGTKGVIYWRAATQRLLFWLNVVAWGVGGVGFWLHNHGKIGTAFSLDLRAWYSNTMRHVNGPPHFAPLAFCGLGLMGMLATARWYQGDSPALHNFS